MDTGKTWQLLAKGGVSRDAIAESAGEQGEGRVAKYNGLLDPSGAEDLGRELAERARAFSPTAVLIWEDPEDVVLGHVVGRELGVAVARSYNADGLVGLSGTLGSGSRVLLVADAFRDPTVVRAMRALVQQQGGVLAATAVMVETAELGAAGDDAGAVVSLVSARGVAGTGVKRGGAR